MKLTADVRKQLLTHTVGRSKENMRFARDRWRVAINCPKQKTVLTQNRTKYCSRSSLKRPWSSQSSLVPSENVRFLIWNGTWLEIIISLETSATMSAWTQIKGTMKAAAGIQLGALGYVPNTTRTLQRKPQLGKKNNVCPSTSLSIYSTPTLSS